jgi:hypothetical protein
MYSAKSNGRCFVKFVTTRKKSHDLLQPGILPDVLHKYSRWTPKPCLVFLMEGTLSWSRYVSVVDNHLPYLAGTLLKKTLAYNFFNAVQDEAKSR